MSAQAKHSPDPSTSKIWIYLSAAQQICLTNGSFDARTFVQDTANFDLSQIQAGGIPSGLNPKALSIWDKMETELEGEIGVEVFADAVNGTLPAVIDYLNHGGHDENEIGAIAAGIKKKTSKQKDEAHMAIQPKRQPGKPLPMGLEKHGLKLWSLLSEKQQKTAKEYGIFDTEYYTRFCMLANDPGTSSGIIEKGGVLTGLTYEGKKVWDMLDADIQTEVFITSAYGTTDNIRKFINAAWVPFKNGLLSNAQIEHGIQTLSDEVEEMISIFLKTVKSKIK